MNDVLRACGLCLLVFAVGAVRAAAPNSLPGLPQPAPITETAVSAPTPPAWTSMNAQQKRELRSRYAAWQALPEAEKQRIREAAVRMAALPPGERGALQARFDGLDQMHREGWQLGPKVGASYARLQPLLGYLPGPQRAPMLALLSQLDAASLEQLSLISLRTPPQGRAALREELLALPVAERTAWLREKVGH